MKSISVVYEDQWLLVVDKPSGWLTIPTPKNETLTLTSILNKDLERKGAVYRLHPCHRLDRETSGLLIYAKGKSTQKKMMDEFHKGAVKKAYLVFVHGAPVKECGEIRLPIEGKTAVTRYNVVQRRRDFSVVEAYPQTGRTNQIRLHFKQIGHPVVGERKFAFRKDFSIKANRLCLHARDVEFIHPITKQHIRLHADMPEYLKEFLNTPAQVSERV